MNKPTIHVFGGAGGIGRWFVDHVFVNRAATVHVYDVDAAALAKSQSPHRHYVRSDGTSDYELPSINSGDWLVFAIPVHVLSTVVGNVCSRITSSCLLIDFSSVKEAPLNIIKSAAPEFVEIVGAHPLFGPLISSPVGQIIALTTMRSSRHQFVESVKRMFQHAGLIITSIGATEHDEAMAYVQALTHFAYLAFSQTIVSGRKTFSELSKLRTPPFHFLSAFAGRVLAGAPATYVNIQRTSAASEVRKKFINACSKLDAAFDASDLTVGINAFEEIRHPLSGSEIQQCTAVSRLATDTLERFERQLHHLKATQTIIFFRAQDSMILHLGKIEEIRPDAVIINERAKKIPTPVGVKIAIPLNDVAVSNYRRIGISFGNGTKNVFLKRKIVFLSQHSQDDWMRKNLYLIEDNCTFEKKGSFKPEALESLVPKLIQGVHRFEFVDSYQRRGGMEKLRFKMTSLPNFDTSNLQRQIQEFIWLFDLK